jgi:hypothetical protein
MLTGREPFRADSAAATAYRRLVEDATPVELIVSSIPPDLSAVVRKCMARERTERWPNAKALSVSLENILAADRLPNAIRDLRSFGPYALLWAIGWSGFAFLVSPSVSERRLLMLVALLVPAGLVLHLWNGAGRGIRLVELARIALWPPEWWSVWWPRALRRQADLWSRLPFVAKAVRIGISLAFPALLLLILVRSGDLNVTDQLRVETGEWAIMFALWVVVALGFVWAKRAELNLRQSVRMLLGPTLASPGWEDPALAHLLAPAFGKVRAPVGQEPSDYLRAIRELAPNVQVVDGLGARAIAAAEGLMKAIDRCDTELADLARDAGPREANRLSTQLEALESGAPGDTHERSELRDLIRLQLEIVRRMQGRREIVQRQRSHFVDLMETFWCAIRDVGESRDGGPEGGFKVDELCAEIHRDLDRSA